jgi:hypothetical protein
MPQPQFYLREGGGYVKNFDEKYELFTQFATSYVTIYTNDPTHPKCMQVSGAANQFKGVEDYASELIPQRQYHLEFAYLTSQSRSLRFNLYDQDNGATIFTATTLQSTNLWANYYKTFTTPANCSTVRLRFGVGQGTKYFYIDSVKVQGNALYRDPDGYGLDFPEVAGRHNLAGGNVTKDVVARHVGFTMNFPNITASAMGRLIRAAKDKKAAIFDDGNNMISTEYGTIYTSKGYIFSAAVVAGGSVHQAWKCITTANRPTGSLAFESTEIATANLRTLTSDGATAVTVNIGENGKYGYLKANFLTASTFTTNSQVKRLRLMLQAGADDRGDLDADGVELWAWDSDQWVMLDRTMKATNMRLNFVTYNAEQAKQFVDTDNQYIRMFAKTRYYKTGTASMFMHVYHIKAIVNENLSREIPLRNQAVASANGVVEVRNLNTKTNLVYNQATSGYELTHDRRGVRVTTDQAVSNVIRVKYRHYYEVAFDQMAEPTVYGGDVSDPRGVGAVRLETLKSIG